MLERLKIFPPQAIEHAAPELRVPADVVMGVRRELQALFVQPAFPRPIAQVPPDGLGTPVLLFLWHEVAALEDQNARAGVRQRLAVGCEVVAIPGQSVAARCRSIRP